MKKTIETYLFLFIFSFVFYSCSNSANNQITYISREDAKIKNIVGELVSLPFIHEEYVNSVYLYNDTVLIVGNSATDKLEHLLGFYNLKTGQLIKGLFGLGTGEDQIITPWFLLKGDFLIVKNTNAQQIIPIDLNKLLTDISYKPFAYQTDGNIYYDMDFLSKDTIIATASSYYNFVSSKNKLNSGIPRFFYMDLKKDTILNVYDYCDFTNYVSLSNYQSENVVVNRKKNRIVTASNALPEITIFDLNGNVIRSIIGPDVYDMNLRVENGVVQCKEYFDSFKYIFKTENSFFVNNAKIFNERDFDELHVPHELLEFDWDGNLLNIYQLDKPINQFSVFDGCLYTICYDYDKKTGHFYKFKLN